MLLQQAFTHRSFLQETGENRNHANEQMELLGDAVLDLVIIDYLYHNFPEKKEGELSKWKSLIVSGKTLHKIADRLGLGEFVLLSENENRNGGRRKLSILEDTFEAVIAAIYLDGGQKAARKFIMRNVIPYIDIIVANKVDLNYKSQLLEFAQARNWAPPVYRVISEYGPDHAKKFEIEVCIKGMPYGVGKGASKKNAQQQAAKATLEMLKNGGNNSK